MAMVHERARGTSRLSRLLTTDFCPWANRFVYWLKEPIGWFVLATAVSVIVGHYLNPIGWTLAASMMAIMAVGMLWPLVAVQMTTCRLHPEVEAIHEESPCRMVFSVQNHIPIPVWGLTIEGYLDAPGDRDDLTSDAKGLPTVGLACLAPLCTAQYSVNVRPALRGHYPMTPPQVACSFPFGIWTARRRLKNTQPLTVWPKLYRIGSICPLLGKSIADQGDGQRGGRSGDFVGVRDFRRGDSAKHINWVASARTDTLIVTQRGGPQCREWEVWIDTAGNVSRGALTARVRTAASLLVHLHESWTPMRITLGDSPLRVSSGGQGRRQILDALAGIPADGCKLVSKNRRSSKRARLEVTSDSSGAVLARVIDPRGGRGTKGCTRELRFEAGTDLTPQIEQFWSEVRDVEFAA